VIDAGEPVAAVPARLVSVDGQSIGDRTLDEDERRFSRTEFSLTWAREMPPYTTLLQGKWWKGTPDQPQISVGQFAARALRLRPGALLVFQAGGKEISGTVANVRETESIRPGSNNQFIFSPAALEGLPVTYVGSIRARADALPLLQKKLFEEFPTVTSVNITEILAVIQRMLDRVSLVIQFVAAFAILTGIVVLASSVASTRYRRVREAVLLKTLGARRAQVVTVQAVEFATIGLLGGLAGCVFASWLASFLLGRLFKTDYEFRWMPLVITVVATPLFTILAGWLASRSILRQKPLEVLREE
jgi:putative ABC transport system permease protein